MFFTVVLFYLLYNVAKEDFVKGLKRNINVKVRVWKKMCLIIFIIYRAPS